MQTNEYNAQCLRAISIINPAHAHACHRVATAPEPPTSKRHRAGPHCVMETELGAI